MEASPFLTQMNQGFETVPSGTAPGADCIRRRIPSMPHMTNPTHSLYPVLSKKSVAMC